MPGQGEQAFLEIPGMMLEGVFAPLDRPNRNGQGCCPPASGSIRGAKVAESVLLAANSCVNMLDPSKEELKRRLHTVRWELGIKSNAICPIASVSIRRHFKGSVRPPGVEMMWTLRRPHSYQGGAGQ